MTPVVEKYREYKKANSDIEEAKELLGDKDFHDMAELELADARQRLEDTTQLPVSYTHLDVYKRQ